MNSMTSCRQETPSSSRSGISSWSELLPMQKQPSDPSNFTGSQAAEQGNHLVEYFRVFYKRRWVALPVFLIVVVASAINTFRTVPRYASTARILIETDMPAVAGLDDLFRTSDGWFMDDFYQTQYRILQSRSLARRTVRRLDLVNHPHFMPRPAEVDTEIWWRRFTGWMNGLAGGILRKERPQVGPSAAEVDETLVESGLVDAVLGGLSIKAVAKTRLVDVSFASTDPEVAVALANGIAESYIEQTVEQRFLASKVAADWLTDQLAGQRKLVERSEARLQTFRERTDAITVDEGGQSIVVQHLADLSAAATKAKTERLQKEALYTQLSAMGPSELEALPAILSNDFVQAIRTQLAALERERAELSQIYGDRHPEMIRVSTAIETANGKLRTEVDTVVTSLRNQYEAALANERALTAALDAQKADVLAFNRSGMEYSVLLREAESDRRVYDSLLGQAQETSISSDLRRSNVRIVDQAELPRYPFAPQPGRNLSLAVAGGFLLAVGLVFFVEYLDNRIKNPAELAAVADLPVIGMVPKVGELNTALLLDYPPPVWLNRSGRSERMCCSLPRRRGRTSCW